METPVPITSNGKRTFKSIVADILYYFLIDLTETPSLIDEASATVTYLGYAVSGASVAGAVWKIKKITTVGTVTAITYATARNNYKNIWNERAILTYVS